MPLDAVKEYQLLFSPFDVRHGGFTGAGINVVSRSGTNDLHGSAFAFGTNERLGPNVPFIRNARYEKQQFGFSLGGPIVHDRLHFFIASEVQRRFIPALGPYVDDGIASPSPLPVSAADICTLSGPARVARARWWYSGNRDQRQSVVECVPSARRTDSALEQSDQCARHVRARRQFDLRPSHRARADQLSDRRLLPIVLAPAFSLGGQALGGGPAHLQPSEWRLQRASRGIHRHRLRFPAGGKAASRSRDRSRRQRFTRHPAIRDARDRDRPAKRELDDRTDRQFVDRRGTAPH